MFHKHPILFLPVFLALIMSLSTAFAAEKQAQRPILRRSKLVKWNQVRPRQNDLGQLEVLIGEGVGVHTRNGNQLVLTVPGPLEQNAKPIEIGYVGSNNGVRSMVLRLAFTRDFAYSIFADTNEVLCGMGSVGAESTFSELKTVSSVNDALTYMAGITNPMHQKQTLGKKVSDFDLPWLREFNEDFPPSPFLYQKLGQIHGLRR